MLLQLLACQARVEQLEGLLADSQAQLQQAQEQAAVLAAERDAAARNLLRAEAELNDVSDYSTKMFRQVGCVQYVVILLLSAPLHVRAMCACSV